MVSKTGYALLLGTGLLLLFIAVYRDSRIAGTPPLQDLRNRVVGARLTADGRLPYFYRWKPGDPIRYYDPENADTGNHPLDTVSVITGTPFLHQGMTPLAEMPESKLEWVWLGIEYGCWAGILILVLPLATTARLKTAVTAAAVAFLFSGPWKAHVLQGQYYILIPCLAALGYRLLSSAYASPAPTRWAGLLAGLIVTMLAGIRPNTILLFLPFLPDLKRFSISFRIAFLVPVILAGIWIGGSSQQRTLWRQYSLAVTAHIHRHLAGNPWVRSEPDPRLPVWEGIDQKQALAYTPSPSIEKSNVYLLFRQLFHRSMSLGTLESTCIIVLLLLAVCFCWIHRPGKGYNWPQLALLGYCLYMVSDLFSPVMRWPYYAVQWLFPLLLALAVYDPRKKGIYAGLLACFFPLMIDVNFASLAHAAGEYGMLTALVLILLVPSTRPKWKNAHLVDNEKNKC